MYTVQKFLCQCWCPHTQETSRLDYQFKPLQWEQLPIDPAHRLELDSLMFCDDDGNLFAFFYNMSRLMKFNPATNTVTKLATRGFGHPGDNPSVVMNEDRLIVFGGRKGADDFMNEISVCNLKTLYWREMMTTGPGPSPRHGSGMVRHEKNLYVIGGFSEGKRVSDIYKLDLTTSTWDTVWTANSDAGGPKNCIDTQVAVSDNKLIFFGIRFYVRSNNLGRIPAFDLKSRSWTFLNTIGDTSSATDTNFPRSLFLCTVLQRGHEAIVLEHEHDGSSVWKLNLVDLQWTKLIIQLPQSTYNYSAALSPKGTLYVMKNKESVWKCWLTVPTLRDICWEAIGHLQPNLEDTPKDQLIASGIPRDLISRLGI